jgi:hypothetical protein
MRELRQNVSRTLIKLRAETEKLQREDEVMRDQESKLRQSYRQLEQTQLRYRAKGKRNLKFLHTHSLNVTGCCSTVGSGRNQGSIALL